MSRTASRRLAKRGLTFLILGLLVLVPATMFALTRSTPQSAIRRKLKRAGVDERTVKFWTAVSFFETDEGGRGVGWNSRVFKDSKNLFNLRVPNSKTLPYGEHQTIYGSLDEAAQGLVDHVIRPFRYPLQFKSLSDLVAFMKTKNYFESSLDSYQLGAARAYRILYPGEIVV